MQIACHIYSKTAFKEILKDNFRGMGRLRLDAAFF